MKPTFSLLLKRGELPVTCGDKQGTLYPDKLARGDKCILSQNHWFTPCDFERFSGRSKSRNWKLSIRCQNTPLKKLIEEGYLQCPGIYRAYGWKRATVPSVSVERSGPPSISSIDTDESSEDLEEWTEEEDSEEDEENREPVDLSNFQALSLPVSCASVSGILHKKRFAGSRSKSIRTEERWFTPEQFIQQELTLTDGHWEKDILCYGKNIIRRINSGQMDPLDLLTEEEMTDLLRNNKTELSYIQEPHIFLDQLQRHDLVPEKVYKKVITMQEGVYEVLNWLENKKGQYVKKFWRCVFQDHMLKKYPILDSLRKSNLDRSFRNLEKLPEAEKPRSNKGVKRAAKEQEQKKGATKRKKCGEETKEEKPGPSSVSSLKKPAMKPTFFEQIRQMNSSQMDPQDFLTEEMITFFHSKKTELSCMEEPHTFLNQLRDHDLVPEDLYKKVIDMRSKEKREKGVYKILDLLENKKGQHMKRFWSCVFQDHMLQKYPTLRSLRNSILDGSFRNFEKLPEAEKPSSNKGVKRAVKKQEQKKGATKRKKSDEETDEEKPGPSSVSSLKKPGPSSVSSLKKPGPSSVSSLKKPGPSSVSSLKKPGPSSVSSLKKSPMKSTFSLLLQRGELPVTCGDKKGTLYPDKLAKGDKCILSQDLWFTPCDFERCSGKGSSKNWKLSIRCQNTPLQKLIKEGHLQCRRTYSRKRVTVPSVSVKSSRPRPISSIKTDESSEDLEVCLEEDSEQEDDDEEYSEPVDLSKFRALSLPVSCGSVRGILHKKRFAGSHSRSIRTEERWFTPEQFIQQELMLTDRHWEKDILCHGKTLHYLVKKKILQSHSLLCPCRLCRPKNKWEQDNDDVCYMCNSKGKLVYCDECPRAFHHHCHLPTLQLDTPGDKWICTYCVLKTNQRLWSHMSRKGALSTPVSGNILRCEYLLFVYKADTQHVFTSDPTKREARYSSMISKPMWLNKVKTKLQKNKYRTVGQFVRDTKLIFNNCQTFYKDKKYGRMAAKIRKKFEKEFKTVFKIQ